MGCKVVDRSEELTRVLRQALTGRGAHVLTAEVFDGLDWRLAGRRPEGAAHTVFQVLGHLVYWHDWALEWIETEKPEAPEHAAESWPDETGAEDREAWESTVDRYKKGLATMLRHAAAPDLLADRGGKSILEILQLIASHDSYHAGQVATLRRVLGSWPPPGGGATW